MRKSFGWISSVILLAGIAVLAGCDSTEKVCEPCVQVDHSWELQYPTPFGSTNFKGAFGVAGHVYVFGDFGRIAHFDGSDWDLMEIPTSSTLISMWGSAATDLYAVNSNYQIFHYDGTAWSTINLPMAWEIYPRAVWGLSADDVWVAGYGYNACHYNGTGWSSSSLPGTYTIAKIWGASGSDIYAVGYNGAILHYNGSSWSRVSHGLTTGHLYSVWGSSADDVWAVGESGTILRYDGLDWDDLSGGGVIGANYVYDVQGTASDNVYLNAGNNIYLYNGSVFSRFADYGEIYNGGEGIWVDGDAIFMSGYVGSINVYEDGEWSLVQEDCDLQFYDVWSDGPSNAWAVGENGAVFHYDGSAWARQEGLAIPAMDLRAIDGASDNLYACGEYGTVIHFDGSAWSDITDNALTTRRLNGCFAAGSEAFFVGEQGTIVRAEGTTLETMSSGTSESITGVWGAHANDVYASVINGSILHYDGISWSTVYTSAGSYYFGVWGASSSSVYVCGHNGILMHWNGSEWRSLLTDTREGLICVWGSSDSDIYMSSGYSIFHFDGYKWVNLYLYQSMPSGHAQSISGSAEDNVFAAGAYGNIIHYGRK